MMSYENVAKHAEAQINAGSGSGSFQESNCLGSLCSHDFKPNKPTDSSPTTGDLVITPLGTPESRAGQTADSTALAHTETPRTFTGTEAQTPAETAGKDKIVGNTDTGVTNNYAIPGGQVVFNNYRDMSDPGEPTLQMFEATGNDNEKPEVKENAVVKSQKSVLEDGRVMITQTFQNGSQGEYIVGEDKYQLRLANGSTSTFKLSAPNSVLYRTINKGNDTANKNKEDK